MRSTHAPVLTGDCSWALITFQQHPISICQLIDACMVVSYAVRTNTWRHCVEQRCWGPTTAVWAPQLNRTALTMHITDCYRRSYRCCCCCFNKPRPRVLGVAVALSNSPGCTALLDTRRAISKLRAVALMPSAAPLPFVIKVEMTSLVALMAADSFGHR